MKNTSSSMTPDQLVLLALEKKFISVDPLRGLVYYHRFRVPKSAQQWTRHGTRVSVHVDEHRIFCKASRIIWLAVNGPIPDGLMVCHVDRNHWNDRLDNLCLRTVSESSRNYQENVRIDIFEKRKHIQLLLQDPENRPIDIARSLGVTPSTVYRIRSQLQR